MIKDFLSQHLMRLLGINTPLTRSYRFLVDLLITFIHNPPYPASPHTWPFVMNEYEPKYGFMCTRYYGGLRSKDYLHNSHLENNLLWQVSKTFIWCSPVGSIQWTHNLMSTHIFVLVSLHKWSWDQPPSQSSIHKMC